MNTKCQRCGTEYKGNFCPTCGTPAQPPESPPCRNDFVGGKKFPYIVAVCFSLWFFVIPLIIGIVLLIIWSKKYRTLVSIQQRIDDLVREIGGKRYQLEEQYAQKKKLLQEDYDVKSNSLQSELSNLNNELATLRHEVIESHYQFSDYDGITSEECRNKLSVLKTEEKSIAKAETDRLLSSISNAKERRVRGNDLKQLLRCFSAECDNATVGVSVKNIDTVRTKIRRSFETLNKLYETDQVFLSRSLLENRLEQLNLVYTYELKKQQEAEEQREIRQQMLEEEKVRREVEQEKKRIEKEEAQFQNEIRKLMTYMQKATVDVEKNLYIDKINELEAKLQALEKDKKNVFEREANTRAGFVYVISNIGSFGEGVYKIGMTRRLIPMDRVKELGDASVPFPFDVHAMIFSSDAPSLETTLHRHFRNNELNRVNPRKEFFRVDLQEIEKVVKENHNATVTFTMAAEAAEYRQSLKLLESE